jgi:MFS family permease
MNEPAVSVEETPASPVSPPRGSLRGLLAGRDFRLLWAANAATMSGDFFTYVALAWVTLDLTHSGAAVGAVLAIQTAARVGLVLFGGALVDRATPRSVMLRASVGRALLTGAIAALLAAHLFFAWELFPAALLLGVVGGLFFPARGSALPTVTSAEHLEVGNGVLQVTTQVAGVVGPVVAGAVVAWRGNAAAFALDSAGYALAAVCVALMHAGRQGRPAGRSRRLLADVGDGLRSVWEDVPLRGVILVLAAINFCAAGPLDVGMAVLARYDWGGAQSLGLVFGGFGLGAGLGALLVGALPRRPQLGATMIGVCFWLGAGLAAFGMLGLIPAIADAIVTGVAIGFVNVIGLSWVQRRTPPERLGRAMSVIGFASVGLTPVSYALAAPLVAFSPPLLFVAAGALLAVCGFASLASRRLRTA